MLAMPKPRPPYLHRQVTRFKKVVWYVRKRTGAAIRIKGEFGSPEFMQAYSVAVASLETPKEPKVSAGSLKWLWERYRETVLWQGLSAATRKQRENIMSHVLAASGDSKAASILAKHIAAGRDRRAPTPSQARNFLDCMRGLFRWAAEAGHVDHDPTAAVANPRKKPTSGFPVWTEEDIDAYQRRWPVGTRERVWLDVLLYTGLRRGDAVKLGRQHVRDGVIILRTEKSSGAVPVTIPILPALAATLAAGPCADLAFICGMNGKPLTKETFGNMFRKAANAAGVKKAAHGVRKRAATRAAENSATTPEMDAIFGWRGGNMAALYTREADRMRLAKGAISKLERTPDEQPMRISRKRMRILKK